MDSADPRLPPFGLYLLAGAALNCNAFSAESAQPDSSAALTAVQAVAFDAAGCRSQVG